MTLLINWPLSKLVRRLMKLTHCCWRKRSLLLITAPLVGERSIAINLSVCLCVACASVWRVCVCLSASISLEPLDRSSRNLLRRFPVAVARSSSGGVAMLCTSGSMDDVTFGRSRPYGEAWLAALRHRGGVWCLRMAFLFISCRFYIGYSSFVNYSNWQHWWLV